MKFQEKLVCGPAVPARFWDGTFPVGCLCVPAVYSDWSVLSELLLGFVHLTDEIDEAFSRFWHPLLGPVSELELADGSGLAILGTRK